MRQTRRGCFAAQGSGAVMYMWDIYTISHDFVRNESEVGLTQGKRTYFADSITIAADGTIGLVNASRQYVSYSNPNLYLKKYTANKEQGNEYANYIKTYTRTSGNSFYYDGERVTVADARGDFIGTVESEDPYAYPENGIQGEYWYVLQQS